MTPRGAGALYNGRCMAIGLFNGCGHRYGYRNFNSDDDHGRQR